MIRFIQHTVLKYNLIVHECFNLLYALKLSVSYHEHAVLIKLTGESKFHNDFTLIIPHLFS